MKSIPRGTTYHCNASCMATPVHVLSMMPGWQMIIYNGSPSRPHSIAFYDRQGEGCLLLPRSSTGTHVHRPPSRSRIDLYGTKKNLQVRIDWLIKPWLLALKISHHLLSMVDREKRHLLSRAELKAQDGRSWTPPPPIISGHYLPQITSKFDQKWN